MKPPRKYRAPQPARQSEPDPPQETIILQPRKSVPAGPPVTPMPGSPAPDIIEATPVPRFQLRVVLGITPGSDATKIVLATARFASTVFAANRKLRLALDFEQSNVSERQATLVFTPTRWDVKTPKQLEQLTQVIRDALANFEGATLIQTEVIPQT